MLGFVCSPGVNSSLVSKDKMDVLERMSPAQCHRYYTHGFQSEDLDALVFVGTEVAGNRPLVIRNKESFKTPAIAPAIHFCFRGFHFDCDLSISRLHPSPD